MSQPTRHEYAPGQRVLVEAEVVSYEWGQPYGAVSVIIREATDFSHMLDGVDAVVPQALVSLPEES